VETVEHLLTIQTNINNLDRVVCNENTQQPTINDADNMIAVNTTFGELSSVVTRNEEG